MPLLKKKPPDMVAAIDLGSNSFHMIIAKPDNDNFQIVDRLREMVRLSAGLDSNNEITAEAQERALTCLERFGQRIGNLPADWVRIVGTNTLRKAGNSRSFIKQAEAALGFPIQIISGIEEARLIYLGVAHDIAANNEHRLVVDIGGGSTEVIIGEGFAPLCMESLYMGCVTMTQQYFANGHITPAALKQAEIAARVELEPIVEIFKQAGWQKAIGASGTIKAINKVTAENGWSEHGITRESLKKLIRVIKEASHVDTLALKGLSADRAPIFPGGVAILYGLFKALNIEHMDVSDSALREGLVHDLVGRIHHEDVRGRSVANLAKRYHADREQVARIVHTVTYCIEQVAESWKMEADDANQWLCWAAQLHEIGLDIAHSHYHKHGAYIAEHADLFGFTYQEQQLLAVLIRLQRRKLSPTVLRTCTNQKLPDVRQMIVLFRLAVLLHRSRSSKPLPAFQLTAKKKKLVITFPDGWLNKHPLTHADLEQEASYLNSINYDLTFG